MARRLAAIMFTDLTGYTGLAQADEAAALRLLQEQEKLVRPVLEVHRGRKVKSMGDGLLIEFPDALDAVESAVDLQRHVHEHNAQEGARPLKMRIGIHLGDVERRGTDIVGDAVNVASRVEPLAEPEGVCLSEPVFVQVRSKVPYQFEKVGSKSLNGVREPIEIYRVVLPWTAKELPSTSPGPTGLAVLPFANISPDPGDEYFADGLTEELITVLSQLSGLRVIARTSVMPYKSTSKGVTQIGAELGVSSILEGSVRKAGNRLRITAQLIDAGSQGHVWVRTYDRHLDDVFAVQSDIAKQVTESLKVELKTTDRAPLPPRTPVRSDSYLAYLKGRTLMHTASQASLTAAKEQFELAISLDSTNASAYSGLSDVTRRFGGWYATAPHTGWDETSRRLVARAIELDPNLAEAHTSLALVMLCDSNYAAAEKEFQLALSLNPSYSPAHHWYAEVLEDEARIGEALEEFALAEAADPLSPFNLYCSTWLSIWLGRLDEAFVKIQKLDELQRDAPGTHLLHARYHLSRSNLAGCLAELTRWGEGITDPRLQEVARALYFALSGEKERSRDLLRRVETLPEFSESRVWVVWAYCELGDLDGCYRWAHRGVSFNPIRLDPRLEPMRKDPRFPMLLKQRNLA